MRTAAALRCPGAWVGQSRFRGNLGSIFFFSDQKSTFFNFDFDKKWFGWGLNPLAVGKKKLRTFFFLRAPVMGLAKNNSAEFGDRKSVV